MPMVQDKHGNPIDVHHRDGSFKISPFERDSVYQRFLQAFPEKRQRNGILREFLDETVRSRFIAWTKRESQRFDGRLSAKRIDDFVREAVATEAGVLPKSERWDWWVGCSLR